MPKQTNKDVEPASRRPGKASTRLASAQSWI